MSARRYRFGPLEQRGVVGPLRMGQVAVLGVAALLVLAALYTFRSWIGMGIAFGVLAAAGAAIYLPVEGGTPEEWAPVALRWLARRSDRGRGFRSASPGVGATVKADGEIAFTPSLPEELSGLRMLEVPYGPSHVGVLHDKKAGTYCAAIAVRAGSFGLLDSAEQERKLDAWGSVLASLARDGSPVRRLQWIERTLPARGDEHADYLHRERDRAVPLESNLVTSYIDLVESAAPVTQEHEILLVLQICERRAARELRRLGGGTEAACQLILREAESFGERLSMAEVTVFGLLTPRRYAGTIRDAFDPYGRQARARASLGDAGREGTDPALMGPTASQESWGAYRSDSAHHITAWISGWPRTDVGPTFLTPLLMQTTAVRTIACCIEPIPHLRAMRKAEAARTAEVAEEIQRERQGFLTNARTRRRQQAAARREEELADGHAEMRFTGFVGFDGTDAEDAERHYSEGEHAGALARLEFRRLYGEQEASFMNLLPIAWGLK